MTTANQSTMKTDILPASDFFTKSHLKYQSNILYVFYKIRTFSLSYFFNQLFSSYETEIDIVFALQS
jgi:hypothetical protein